MRRIVGTLAAVVSLALLGPAAATATHPTASATTAQSDGLSDRIDALLADPRYRGSEVAVVVRDAQSGNTLYDHNGDLRLLPASNTKLFTSSAGMDLLGPDFRFKTDVLTTGRWAGGTLRGDLFLRGGGDPTILADDYADLAGQLSAAGIRQVTGDLVADDTFFDHQRLGPFWSWDDEPFYYSAQISALTVAPNTDYDSGTVIVNTRPAAAAGQPAQVSLQPETGYVTIVNDAVTGPAGSDNTISVEREHGNNIIHVTGSIPAGGDLDQEWSTVWEPTGYAADVFRRALAAKGIQLIGRVRDAATPAGARVLASHQSMTLGQMLIPWLKLSNNMHAEHVTKTIGAEIDGQGSWDAGVSEIGNDVKTLDVDTSTTHMVDGSGLSRGDDIPPDQIANLLVAVQGRPWFQQWYDALPIACNPARFVGGTLRSRMCGTAAANNLHAKTGSLTGASALSGYVTDADGKRLVFSMVSNNVLSGVQDIENALGVTLAQYSEKTGAAPAVRPFGRPGRARAGLECSWTKAGC